MDMDMDKVERTAGLSLEYQREYGSARRNVDITNLGDYPVCGRVGRVFGPGFFEEISSIGGVDVRPFDHNVGNAFLVGQNPI